MRYQTAKTDTHLSLHYNESHSNSSLIQGSLNPLALELMPGMMYRKTEFK